MKLEKKIAYIKNLVSFFLSAFLNKIFMELMKNEQTNCVIKGFFRSSVFKMLRQKAATKFVLNKKSQIENKYFFLFVFEKNFLSPARKTVFCFFLKSF